MSSSIECENYTVDQLLSLTRVAEQAERFPDMCKFMHVLVNKKCAADGKLNVDERNLLSVAYKNVVGFKRSSWRTLQSRDDSLGAQLDNSVRKAYMALVEGELKAVCQELLDLLASWPLKKVDADLFDENSTTAEDKKFTPEDGVFYLKMCGDYYRYLAEVELAASAESNVHNKQKAEEYYKKAMDMAKDKLPETHPTRLGLALNFSVCYFEILKKKEEACKLAKEAFDAAIEKLDTLNDSSYKDSTLIMQLLRDNLTLWTSENTDDKDDNADQQ